MAVYRITSDRNGVFSYPDPLNDVMVDSAIIRSATSIWDDRVMLPADSYAGYRATAQLSRLADAWDIRYRLFPTGRVGAKAAASEYRALFHAYGILRYSAFPAVIADVVGVFRCDLLGHSPHAPEAAARLANAYKHEPQRHARDGSVRLRWRFPCAAWGNGYTIGDLVSFVTDSEAAFPPPLRIHVSGRKPTT